jgi:hypothetical protein
MGNKDARRREAKKPKRKKSQVQPEANQLAARLVERTIKASEGR